MNIYLVFTRDGRAWSIRAAYSHIAEEAAALLANCPASCWYLGEAQRQTVYNGECIVTMTRREIEQMKRATEATT